MSVPKDKRKQGKLEVCVQAHSLCVYTLQITANKNVFLPAYQDTLTNRIVDAALSIHMKVWAANNILVNSREDYQERHRLQEDAAIQCNVLLSLIQIAWKLFHLSSKRVEFWGGNVMSVRNLIRACRDSDTQRYKMWT